MAYRRDYRDPLLTGDPIPAALELMAETFVPHLRGRAPSELAQLRRRFQLTAHSVGLSIGSVERPAEAYLEGVARFLALAEPQIYSDHLAITVAGGRDLGHLTPIWYGERALEVVVRNLAAARRVLGVLPCLEIIAEPFELPGARWSQARFASEVHRATGCGVHLDLANVHINATNFGFCPRAFIEQLPADAIEVVHVVGYGRDDRGVLIDSHDHPMQPEIWDLLDFTLARAHPQFVIVERDDAPPYAEVMDEVTRIRAALDQLEATAP